MESAEQPADNLHNKVGISLKQMGHHTISTIPPNEGPVLAEDLKGMIKDVGYNAKTALEGAVSGGVTHVRTTNSAQPSLIAALREKMRRRTWK